MTQFNMKKHYRIVEESKKYFKDIGVFDSFFYIQELKSFMGFKYWRTLTELNCYGSDVVRSRIVFGLHDTAVAYVKYLRTPLLKDKYTYI